MLARPGLEEPPPQTAPVDEAVLPSPPALSSAAPREGGPDPIPLDLRSASLTGLFLLSLFCALYLARGFLVPMVVALLLAHLLRPAVRALRGVGLPEKLGAALVLAALLGSSGVGVYQLAGPANAWMMAAPRDVPKIRARLARILAPVERVSRSAERVAEAADVDGRETPKVEVRGPSLAETLFGETRAFLGALTVVVFLLYFLLASGPGDPLLGKLVRALPRLGDKKRAVQIAREAEACVSSYLVTTTLINLAFGVVVGLAMGWLGLPNPVLWGVLAAVTNFVPFLGAVACTVALTAVALVHFDDLGRALLVPAVFQALNLLEGSWITPRIVGRQLSLDPIVVFLAVLYWGFLWGVAGALLAVPITAAVKIACDRIDRLAPVGEFLGEGPRPRGSLSPPSRDGTG